MWSGKALLTTPQGTLSQLSPLGFREYSCFVPLIQKAVSFLFVALLYDMEKSNGCDFVYSVVFNVYSVERFEVRMSMRRDIS